MKNIIIAEKPSLALNIVNALYKEKFSKFDGFYESENFIVTFVFGHLFQLYDIEDYTQAKDRTWKLDMLPFVPKEFEYKLKNDTGLKKQYSIISKLLQRNDVDKVINCGDCDAEGEVLVALVVEKIFEKFKIHKPVLRMWSPDQTPQSLAYEVYNAKDDLIYDNWKQSGLTRAALDWCLGINCTRLVTLKAKSSKPLKVGRVMVPIIKKIYDRDMEIKNFISEKYYQVESKEKTNGEDVKLVVKKTIFNENQQNEAEKLANFLNSQKTIVTNIESKNIKKQPSHLFSLSTLQNLLSKKYKYTMKESLTIIQKLYESGFITYPRTNSEYLSEGDKVKVKKIIELINNGRDFLIFKDKKSIFDDSKIESHSALIPTLKIPKEGELEGKNLVIYNTVMNRFIGNFLNEDAIVKQTTMTIKAADYEFKLFGNVVIQKGFLAYEDNQKIEDKLPNLKVGQEINTVFKAHEKNTVPPKKMTITKLNNYLKNPFSKIDMNDEEEEVETNYKKLFEGVEIGTEATRTDIIEKCKLNNYISEKKSILSIEPLGIELINMLNALNINLYAEKTVEFSKKLKQVFKGEITKKEVIKMVEVELNELVEKSKNIDVKEIKNTKEVIGKCPICGENVYESSRGYYCEGFKDDCDFYVGKNDLFMNSRGKIVTKNIVKALIKNGKFNDVKVKGFKKKDSENKYDAYVRLIKKNQYYNLSFVPKEEVPKKEPLAICPRCGGEILENSKALYCSNYKDGCKFGVWKENKFLQSKGIKLNAKHLALLIKGSDIIVKGIKAKDSDKLYNAKLSLEDTEQFVNIKFEPTESELRCPRCKSPIRETKDNYYCSNYKECNYVVFKNNKFLEKIGIKLKSNHIEKMIQGKKIKFKNIEKKDKTGTYDIYLFLEDAPDGKVNFKMKYCNQ